MSFIKVLEWICYRQNKLCPIVLPLQLSLGRLDDRKGIRSIKKNPASKFRQWRFREPPSASSFSERCFREPPAASPFNLLTCASVENRCKTDDDDCFIISFI